MDNLKYHATNCLTNADSEVIVVQCQDGYVAIAATPNYFSSIS